MKKLLSMVLTLALFASLCACGISAPEASPQTETEAVKQVEVSETEQTLSPAVSELSNGNQETLTMGNSARGLSDFDSQLIDYLDVAGYADQNYMVSPLSLRAALALAVSGADGTTKDALLRAMGFASMDELNAWYAGVLETVDAFGSTDGLKEALPRVGMHHAEPQVDRSFRILNSVWHNADKAGSFQDAYVSLVEQNFRAIAKNLPAVELTKAVNDWVKEATNGLIPSIADDLSKQDAVLVNALYLRSGWLYRFDEYATEQGSFITIDGGSKTVEMMKQREDFAYYEDENTQLVVLPLDGNIKMAFVLGDSSDLAEKLEKLSVEPVIVTIPKMDMETSFEKGELPGFLNAIGAGIALTEAADFSLMSKDSAWFIQDIIQKTKIKTDEDGIEAAAVTAIMMKATGIMPPTEPKVFTADRPFSFCIYSDYGDSPELLFYGQYVR